MIVNSKTHLGQKGLMNFLNYNLESINLRLRVSILEL